MPGKIAVLIDAENIDPAYSQQIFSYARSQGEVTIQQIYGSGMALNDWADSILENTIQPCFTLRPSKYKNSTDISLTIGAMEILAKNEKKGEEKIDAIIIASSDSDFSPLAFHLRAAGMDVIGMGEPGRFNPMWPKACTEFVTLDTNTQLTRNREESDHSTRVEIIRKYIDEQIEAHGGRIKSGDLFRALAGLQEYNYDQRRSLKKPLEYLEKFYSEWITMEPGERGSYWIGKRMVEEPASTEENTQPTITEENKEEIPTEIPPEDNEKVRTIVAESKNMRVVYNTLSKAFGRSLGLQYYSIVKKEIAAARMS